MRGVRGPADATVTDVCTVGAVLAEIHRQIAASGGRKAWGARHGIPASVISEVLAGKRDVPDAMANAAGFVSLTLYRRISQNCETAAFEQEPIAA